MACTALLIPDPKNTEIQHKIKIITTPLKEGIQVDWFSCDDEWLPDGLLNNNVKEGTEFAFHADVRKGAREKGHFVVEQSTNPEINVYLDEQEGKQSVSE